MSKLPCSVLKISGGQIPQMSPPWLPACLEGSFVEPTPTCCAQNLLLVSFVTRACGNIAHGPLVFIVNRYCC